MIAFDGTAGGNWDIYVISVNGGRPIWLTTNPAEDAIPNWSRNGCWVYFCSTRTGRNEIWKASIDGRSEQQMTSAGGYSAVESADGRYLYYKGEGDTPLWKMPVSGGSPTKLLDSVSGRLSNVTQKGIYIATGGPKFELRFLDFTTGSTRRIGALGTWAYADVSPDGRWAMFYPGSHHWGDNLMLVEGF